MSKSKSKSFSSISKPKKCDISDPTGTQKKACLKRQGNGGMYCKNCSFSKRYSLI